MTQKEITKERIRAVRLVRDSYMVLSKAHPDAPNTKLLAIIRANNPGLVVNPHWCVYGYLLRGAKVADQAFVREWNKRLAKSGVQLGLEEFEPKGRWDKIAAVKSARSAQKHKSIKGFYLSSTQADLKKVMDYVSTIESRLEDQSKLTKALREADIKVVTLEKEQARLKKELRDTKDYAAELEKELESVERVNPEDLTTEIQFRELANRIGGKNAGIS